ncbi:MAG: DUF1631 domain-containing protein [Burkholderiaceae bacterium]|nr:DUF1631 domain-containing protein [Burkholderiaceae bacterium]
MEFTPNTDTPRPGGDVPYVTAAQASALMKSAMAIANELIATSFPDITKAILDELSGTWDFDVSSPLVQRLLVSKSSELHHAFVEHLKQAQDQSFHEITVGRVQPPPGALDAETLSLVDSISVESNTVVERHASKVAGFADLALRDLNLVVAYVLGRSAVRNSENPLGPNVYVRALLRAAEQCELHKEAWEFLLTRYEKPLGEELGQIVRQLLEHFANHGVDVRAIRRSLAVPKGPAATWQPPGVSGGGTAGEWGGGTGQQAGGAGRTGRDGSVAAAEGGPSRAPVAQDEPTQLLGGLLTRLQANARGSRLPPLPSLGAAPPDLLRSIGEIQKSGFEQFVETGDFAMLPPVQSISSMREELTAKSTRTVDKLTIELVGMLFDHVMQDKQVPAEIKARISRLQFPVLKAALMDAAFFASSAHPARKLIDRIAGTSAGWEPYGDDNQKYLHEVERVIGEILKKFETDLSVFEKVYAEFDRFVSEIDPGDSDPVSRAKKALEAAEKHEILTINTTIQVRRAFERVDLEPYIKEFLLGPWVKVLVAATVRSETQPGFAKAFRDVIHELVWSVQPKASTEDRNKLVKMIPGMVRVLRDGLALINLSERDREQFFGALMESHAMAVKPVDQATYIKSSLLTSELRAKIDGMQLSGVFPVTTVPGGIRVSTGLSGTAWTSCVSSCAG